ncbi:hypothetical protein HETIRDRAFT_411955 [Heterobasidion irregulare TC 32-1]|uniref:Uncharacterized protein n=1 Tax=Heterobasidion irregulare (strain TC 32-1) TaxID=747525 RepID=W4JSV8_HETIT|nr:uncharacterized protein HETIRDRAFT_411955 [Heterobasidion irregulare TC 32-1]ETW76647.1 hypothetical protein HETIRDRAFT_411955 [Heterobasidion irregulare TC 32-1]
MVVGGQVVKVVMSRKGVGSDTAQRLNTAAMRGRRRRRVSRSHYRLPHLDVSALDYCLAILVPVNSKTSK